MRSRSFSALLTFTLSAVLLVGCTPTDPEADKTPTGPSTAAPEVNRTPTGPSPAAPEADKTPTGPPPADLCDSAAPSGPASEAVTVEGAVGELSKLTFEVPLEIDRVQTTVIHEGSGDPVESGQLITFAFTSYRADNGEEIGSFGYGENAEGPTQISSENTFGRIFGCASPGTRVVAAFPSLGGYPEVIVYDFLEIAPSAAWGEPQEPVEGMPIVTLAEDGEPTIEVPGGEPPTAVELGVLKKGDVAAVALHQAVLVQYIGVKWSDGSVFHSSWDWGAPAFFPPGFDAFRQALEGQAEGSQIIVVIPPEFRDGTEEWSEPELAGETLVLVVDILAAH